MYGIYFIRVFQITFRNILYILFYKYINIKSLEFEVHELLSKKNMSLSGI